MKRLVESQMWDKPEIKALPPLAFRLYVFLLTGPYQRFGIINCAVEAMASQIGATVAATRKNLTLLVVRRLVSEQNGTVFLRDIRFHEGLRGLTGRARKFLAGELLYACPPKIRREAAAVWDLELAVAAAKQDKSSDKSSDKLSEESSEKSSEKLCSKRDDLMGGKGSSGRGKGRGEKGTKRTPPGDGMSTKQLRRCAPLIRFCEERIARFVSPADRILQDLDFIVGQKGIEWCLQKAKEIFAAKKGAAPRSINYIVHALEAEVAAEKPQTADDKILHERFLARKAKLEREARKKAKGNK